MVREGQSVHVGGFLGCGSPDAILAELVKAGAKGLTLVCNDTAVLDEKNARITGVAPLIKAKCFSKVIVSHIGTNPETQRQMNAGELEVTLVPQGTLAERVRAAGAGLGGILTPTGVGTEVEQGKQKILLGDKAYLLEEALPGDVALLKAKRADKAGNLVYSKTARNFNPLMATACKLVIVEVEELVEIGDIDPDQVHTPSIFVDYIVVTS
jgi:acetate CoA/acetoacetate CoA-transferase alpha subunit